MALGITNGKIRFIESAGHELHPRFVAHFTRPDGSEGSYTLSTAPTEDLTAYKGKFLQVEMSMVSGQVNMKEWFTIYPIG